MRALDACEHRASALVEVRPPPALPCEEVKQEECIGEGGRGQPRKISDCRYERGSFNGTSFNAHQSHIYIYIICYIYACMYVYIFIQQEVHILQNIAIRAYLRKSRCLGMCALNHARTP